jgi:hypothetical protein
LKKLLAPSQTRLVVGMASFFIVFIGDLYSSISLVGAGVLFPFQGGRIELNFNCPLKYQKEDGLKSGFEFGMGVSI